MSEPEPKRDAIDFVDELLIEEEAERIAALSPESLHAEMAKSGLDPARAGLLVERVLAHEPSVVVAEPREKSSPPGSVRTTPSMASIARRRNTRRASMVWVGVAAVMATAAIAAARPAILAWLAPAPVPSSPSPPSAPAPEERAAALREEALTACAKGYLRKCEQGLDEAKKLDPSGENDVRVQKARGSIREQSNPAPFEGAKPPLSPN
jgi:hypothetical protein